MTRETVMRMFNTHRGANFTLLTNRDRYGMFHGYYEGDRMKEKSKVKHFAEDYLVLEVDHNYDIYDSGVFEWCIPYDEICAIRFVSDLPYFRGGHLKTKTI